MTQLEMIIEAIICLAPTWFAVCEGIKKPVPSLLAIVAVGIAMSIVSGGGHWLVMKRISPKSSWWLLFSVIWLFCSLFAVGFIADHINLAW
jgi:hypothetical protein